MSKTISWGDKQFQTLQRPFDHCLEVNEGTPRSGKTTVSVARFAWRLWDSRDQNHMILAYNQEQAYKLVIDCDGFGLMHIFPGLWQLKHDDFGDHLLLQTPTGDKRIYYKGAGKADSHKSFIGMSLGSVFFCEINLLHMSAIQEAFRRTFAAQDRWHIADLNPPPPQDPVIKDIFEVQDTFWQHWTIMDNPIITPARREEIRQVLIKNPYLYARDWEGKRVIPQGVIYAMFDPARHIKLSLPQDGVLMEMFFAGDGGLSDATSIGCYGIYRFSVKDKPFQYRLYRLANWYYSGADTGRVMAMSQQAKVIAGKFAPYCRDKAGRRESCWKIDPACKALRAELELLGIPTDSADNNAHDIRGSTKGIKVGIEYLQSAISNDQFFLVEDATFHHCDFLREIGMYCVDKNGEPIDAYNHAMDETRYANNYFYKRYVVS